MKLSICTGYFCLLYTFSVNAQGYLSQWREKRGDWSIGFNTSTSRYCGDLSERYNIDHPQLSWGIGGLIQYRFDEYVSARAEVGVVHLRGDQQYTKNKINNLSFASHNVFASLGLQTDFYSVDYNQKSIPYAWLSFGVIGVNPTTLYKGQRVSLSELKTENVDYATLAGQIAYGAGWPVIINKHIQLRLEGRYTHVLSDYLDDVSGVYVNKSTASLLAQQVADRRTELALVANDIGAQRGDSNKNDGYFLLSLQLIFKK